MKSKFIQGLYQADEETLANFISMWEESTISKIISSKSIDIYDKIKNHKTNDNYSESIAARKEELLKASNINTLRTILVIQLAKFYNIKLPKKFNLYSLEQIGLNIEQKSIETLNKSDKNFKANNIEGMIQYVFEFLFSSISKKFNKSSNEDKEEISKNILRSIEEMPIEQQNKLKEELKVDEMSEDVVQKALASGALGAAFATTISIAGFSAYTFAASALASTAGLIGLTLPFGAYTGLTSIMAVVSNPIFLIGSMGLLIYILNDKSNDKIRGKLSPFIVSLISILSSKDGKYICESERHIQEYNLDMQQYFSNTSIKKLPLTKKYINLSEDIFESNLVFDISNVPSSVISTCDKSLDFLNRDVYSLNLHQKLSRLLDKTYNEDIKNTNKIIASITVGDLIYDMTRIDPLIVESIDFARKADIPDLFSLAYFSENINIENIGEINQLKGYVAERLVAQQLQSNGYEVEFPESSTQPGYDLLVNGTPFQVKCGSEAFLVNNHFEKYPDIPVLVNEELGELFPDSYNVFTIPGVRNDEITNMTIANLSDAKELLDYEIPLLTIAIISGKQMISVLQNKIDFENALGKAVEQSATRITGGIIGSNILMTSGAILMPAAGIVGGMIGAILGSMTLSEMVSNFKLQKLLTKETDLIDSSIKAIFKKSIVIGKNNLKVAEKKFNLTIEKLKEKNQDAIIQYLTYKFAQECEYRKEKISLMELVIQKNSLVLDPDNKNILTSAQNSIVLTEQIGIHPFNINNEFTTMMQSIEIFQKALRSSELTKYIKEHSGNAIEKTNELFGKIKGVFSK